MSVIGWDPLRYLTTEIRFPPARIDNPGGLAHMSAHDEAHRSPTPESRRPGATAMTHA
jgi:hypothetical protein